MQASVAAGQPVSSGCLPPPGRDGEAYTEKLGIFPSAFPFVPPKCAPQTCGNTSDSISSQVVDVHLHAVLVAVCVIVGWWQAIVPFAAQLMTLRRLSDKFMVGQRAP